DWSPDTMMSTMMTGHVSAVRIGLYTSLGGLRSEVNGCQDWDFVLRVAEVTCKITHIPKVLYHWRVIPGSIASDITAKQYVRDASRRVRADALARRGLDGTVEEVPEVAGYFRVNYQPRGTPLVSIIIPTRDREDMLRRCIQSIESRSHYRDFELIVIDNGSREAATLAFLNELKSGARARVIRDDRPFNFSALNNLAAEQAHGDLLLFLNNDTEVLTPDWLERMAGFAQLAHVGAVGAKLVYPGARQTIQHAGLINLQDGPGHAMLGMDADAHGYFMRNLLDYDWSAVTGACLMIEAAKFRNAGGFDETFPVAYNDVELCFRLVERGLHNVVCQAVRLRHFESQTRGLDHLDAEKARRQRDELCRLYDMHPRFYQHDPFHNVNLHPNSVHFELPR
ncbi:MAG: glycosyltransferase family 2 protein, partial [Halothiobacillaceae bacterium]